MFTPLLLRRGTQYPLVGKIKPGSLRLQLEWKIDNNCKENCAYEFPLTRSCLQNRKGSLIGSSTPQVCTLVKQSQRTYRCRPETTGCFLPAQQSAYHGLRGRPLARPACVLADALPSPFVHHKERITSEKGKAAKGSKPTQRRFGVRCAVAFFVVYESDRGRSSVQSCFGR